MPAFTIDVLLASLVAAAGVGAGWWLRSLVRKSSPVDEQPDQIMEDLQLPDDISREVLEQLYDVARYMQSSVGQHQSDVQKISDELSSSESRQEDEILSAMTKLLATNQRMQQQLNEAQTRLEEQEKQLVSHAQDARTDALTGLANRRVLDDELQAGLSRFEQTHEPMSLMLLDVDHFKKFNDTHGHLAGDEVLRGVAKLIRETADERDIPVRYGGEEFGFIFPGFKIDQVRDRAEKVRAAIANASFHFEGLTLRVTVSVGMAQLKTGEDIAGLIKRADDALYMSKEAGRNCGHWHDGSTCLPLPVTPEAATDEDEVSQSEPPAEPETSLRDEFCEELEHRLNECRQEDQPATIVLVQIDNYDRIISNRGQEAGQLVLRATSQFIQAIMGDTDHVAPFRENALGMLLPGDELTDAVQTVERLRFAIERCKLPVGTTQLRFTVSVGVAQARDTETPEQLLSRAESSCEDASKAGGNCAFFHDGEYSEHSSAIQTAVS